jgi:hypothetical protein
LTGSLAGVNAAIPGYPGFAAQALRYTLATIVLATACWVQGRRHPLDGQRIRLTRRVVWGAGTIGQADAPGGGPGCGPAHFRRRGRRANETTEEERYSGGAAAKPDADGGTACLAHIARTGAPRGAAPPHSVTIQAWSYIYKS